VLSHAVSGSASFIETLESKVSHKRVGPSASEPQGLKPVSLLRLSGTAEAVPFPKPFMSCKRFLGAPVSWSEDRLFLLLVISVVTYESILMIRLVSDVKRSLPLRVPPLDTGGAGRSDVRYDSLGSESGKRPRG
jgi:hypothetical protein